MGSKRGREEQGDVAVGDGAARQRAEARGGGGGGRGAKAGLLGRTNEINPPPYQPPSPNKGPVHLFSPCPNTSPFPDPPKMGGGGDHRPVGQNQ